MLYKRGKVWWLKIMWNGQLIRRSAGTGDRKLARKVEIKLLNRLVDGQWFERDEGEMTLFKDVWGKYLKEEAKYKAESSYSRAQQCAKNFLPVIGDLTLPQVTPAVLSAYKTKRLEENKKIATVVKELQCIRRVFSLCKREWQLIQQSPFEFFKMPSVNNQRVRFLEAGQFEKILGCCPSWLKPVTILARYTGMRRGNLLGLTWGQVDLQNRVVNLEQTKNGRRLTIPLIDTSHKVLAAMKSAKVVLLNCPYVFNQDGKPYSPDQVSVAFKRACKRAGVDNFCFHDLRHDFASQLVQRGNDLYLVQNLLGHRDGRMTQRYAHLRVENLRNAVQTLEGGHKIGHSEDEERGHIAVTP